jgi:hypothetical protein
MLTARSAVGAAVAAKSKPLQAVIVWLQVDHLQITVDADVNLVEEASEAGYPETGKVGRAE